MITAQDIREKGFERARMGGYDMASVDEFLEELADDVAATQKENAVLKSKMKVLVDKIEEYRANEEALHMAVLSAQKLAVQIENEARARAAAMIEEAENKVKARTGDIEAEVERQEKRLAEATAATEKFLDGMRAMCTAQMKNLDAIASGVLKTERPDPKAAEAAQDAKELVEDAVRNIEEAVRIPQEPARRSEAPSHDAPAKARPRKNLDSTQPFTL